MNDPQPESVEVATPSLNSETAASQGPPLPTAEEPSLYEETDPAFDLRRQRILDHRAQAQTHADTLTACLAGANSDLIEVQLLLGEALRKVLTTGAPSLEEFERHGKPIDNLVKLSKQIIQMTKLEVQSRDRSAASQNEAKK